jgi:hypothetical protein
MQFASEAKHQETHNTRPDISWMGASIVGTSDAADSQGEGLTKGRTREGCMLEQFSVY